MFDFLKIYLGKFHLKRFILVDYRPQEVAEIAPRGPVWCQPASSDGDVLHKLRATAKPGHRYGAVWLPHPQSLLGVHQCLLVLSYDLKISMSNIFSCKTPVEHKLSRKGRNELRLLNKHP